MSRTLLLQLRDYWLDVRGNRPSPDRSEIDPIDIPRLLPNVVLTDVHYDPLRFRYRLIGTKIADLSGRDATGCWLDEKLYGDNTKRILRAYRECVANHAPVAVREQVQFTNKEWIVIEALLLPLRRNDGAVDIVLSAVDIVDPSVEKPVSGSRIALDWRAG